MTEQEFKEKIFDLVTDPPCRGCEFWDRQGYYCFLKDMHELSTKCSLVPQILALIKEAGYKSPEECKQCQDRQRDYERILNHEAAYDGRQLLEEVKYWKSQASGK